MNKVTLYFRTTDGHTPAPITFEEEGPYTFNAKILDDNVLSVMRFLRYSSKPNKVYHYPLGVIFRWEIES